MRLSFDRPAIHLGSVTLRPYIAIGLPLSREDLFAGIETQRLRIFTATPKHSESIKPR